MLKSVLQLNILRSSKSKFSLRSFFNDDGNNCSDNNYDNITAVILRQPVLPSNKYSTAAAAEEVVANLKDREHVVEMCGSHIFAT